MELILSLIMTAAVYLFVPTIFWLIALTTNRQYKLSTIKKIVVINGVCGWLLFRIIEAASGGAPTSGASVFLWSGIAYKMLKIYSIDS